MASQALAETGAAPRPAGERIDALDALRGLAVLGIFVINIIGFSMPEIAFSNPKAAGGDGFVNYGLWTFTTVFAEGSMRGLFSLMFGAGVILFTERALYPDGPIRIADLFYRRTIWLVIFGVAHSYLLLMPGDILLIYGLAGLFLFPLRILPPRLLAGLSGAVLAGLVLWALIEELPETALGHEASAIEARAAAGAEITDAEQETLEEWRETYKGNWPLAGELREQIEMRTADAATVFSSNAKIVALYSDTGSLIYWTLDAFMMMLLGMAFYKWRIITAERSLKFYLALAACGYAIGLSFRIWAVFQRWEADFSPILWAWGTFDEAGRMAVTIGHVGMFFTIWKAAASGFVMRALTATGRMALTNYISQTVIANLLFTGIGFGLYGSLDRTGVYGIMVVIWIAQIAFSMWWLQRFRFGPLEWGWRCLTYWRSQPLRKSPVFADKAGAV